MNCTLPWPVLTIVTMSDKSKKSDKSTNVNVSSRVAAWVIDELNAQADEIRPRPTISQMVALALEDYVERSMKAKGKPKPR